MTVYNGYAFYHAGTQNVIVKPEGFDEDLSAFFQDPWEHCSVSVKDIKPYLETGPYFVDQEERVKAILTFGYAFGKMSVNGSAYVNRGLTDATKSMRVGIPGTIYTVSSLLAYPFYRTRDKTLNPGWRYKLANYYEVLVRVETNLIFTNDLDRPDDTWIDKPHWRILDLRRIAGEWENINGEQRNMVQLWRDEMWGKVR